VPFFNSSRPTIFILFKYIVLNIIENILFLIIKRNVARGSLTQVDKAFTTKKTPTSGANQKHYYKLSDIWR